MKNAMKKLMSLLLVAVLLVSVVPFQAAAVGSTHGFASIQIVKQGGATLVGGSPWVNDDTWGPDSLTARTILDARLPGWATMYNFDGAYDGNLANGVTDLDGTLMAADYGESLVLIMSEKTVKTITVDVIDKNKGINNYLVTAKPYTVNGDTVSVNTIVSAIPAGYTLDHIKYNGGTMNSTSVEVADRAHFVVFVTKNGDTVPETTTSVIVFNIITNTGNNLHNGSATVTGDNTQSVLSLIESWRSDWAANYTFLKAISWKKGEVSQTTPIAGGDTVTITLASNSTINGGGSSNNNSGSNSGSNNGGSSGGSVVNDNEYVFNKTNTNNKLDDHVIRLYIYKNTYFGSADRVLDITGGIAADGQVSLYGDVLNLVKDYYSAKTSDGLKLDGLYFKQGNWVSDWADDAYKYEKIDNLDEAVQEYDVNIIVVVNNAKDKTTYASSDNPKTGDEIFMAVTVMGLSATALACVYFFNKKRAVK